MLQRYSTENVYCRYLTVDLNEVRPFRLCNGKFASYLEKNFGLKKLPHDIKLQDLIFDGYFKPSLLIKISDEDIEKNDFRLIMEPDYYPSNKIKTLEEYQHSFDYGNGPATVGSMRVDSTQLHEVKAQKFKPYKAYFAYWKCYQLIDALDYIGGLNQRGSTDDTYKLLSDAIIKREKYWCGDISSVFDLISEFKTISNYVHNTPKIDYSDFEVAEFIVKKNNVTEEFFFRSMEVLLELYKKWDQEIFSGCYYLLTKSKENLVVDVYGLFLIGIATGIDDSAIFDRFTIHDRQPRAWAELKSVLKFPRINYEATFTRFLPYYWSDINKSLSIQDGTLLYEKLIRVESVTPWIRAFYHLHNRLSNEMKGTHGIVFESQRELDNFLVMTLRTESIIRAIATTYMVDASEIDTKDLICSLQNNNNVPKRCRNIFELVSSNWSLTRLKSSPPEIYQPIDRLIKPQSLRKADFTLVQSLLKFFVSRNYFAHHHYKDIEFSNFNSSYSLEALRSSLFTVCFFVSELS